MRILVDGAVRRVVESGRLCRLAVNRKWKRHELLPRRIYKGTYKTPRSDPHTATPRNRAIRTADPCYHVRMSCSPTYSQVGREGKKWEGGAGGVHRA